ncbi:MAG: NAD(P)-dependent oxidoreductase [Ruminococcaceae bacterium]|nr:NAD(P)-dependent oxidoreductase [Oscillospiraceae bacterium]
MKKVIVTGATGFIGSALVKRLLADGVTVYGVDLDKNKLEAMRQYGDFIPVVAEFSDYGKLNELLPQESIDVFFYLAWSGVSGANMSDNAVQWLNADIAFKTMCLADSFLHVKKFVFAGSSYEFKVEPIQIDGHQFFANSSIYGAAKHACRVMCEAYASTKRFFFNSFSFTNVFGLGDCSKRSTNLLIKQFQTGISPKLIQGNHLHDWVYIDDAIEGILAVAEKGLPLKQYYIGARDLNTFAQIVTRVRDILAPNINLEFGTYQDSSYIDYSRINLHELYSDTGFECKADFHESILKTAEWVKTLNV